MDKINKIREYLVKNNLDSAIITKPTNIYYLTNFNCDPHERLLALVIKKDSLAMLVPAMEYESAKAKLKVELELVSYLDTENGFRKLQNKTGNLEKIAIEKDYMTVDWLERISFEFNVSHVESISSHIIDMRKYKSNDEIEKLKKAANLADEAILIARENLKEGITEIELKSIIEFEMKKRYAVNMSFDTIVLFGKNAANPHGESGETKLRKGDLALFDLGVWYEGYASDETRTIFFGTPEKEAEKIYEIVKRANEEAIKHVKPGVSFSYLDKIARDIIEKEGYGEYFNHRLGHGLGLEVHEYPDVSSATSDLLEENMVFTIEPGIYKPGIAGVRIEDDIVVTKDGYMVLTKTEK
ncbi:M24 family metallopeptidase [Oceanivirga miroungae]|uniref:Peptidase M24 n=1 Tax=Oceanivirga miroungae TaxID=1130046 RepID=A0A6I8M8K6_9FUSO|nr:Xaa-Pro peptidase family protein [Oceanivirga miroungae]VWL85855.1 peptidase M24 [Oceanivirga miroungae]